MAACQNDLSKFAEFAKFPFDPIQRAKRIECMVMRGSARSYYRTRFAPQFDCPVTVDSVGCCLQCAYCWNALRNETMKLGDFWEPEEIATKAVKIANKEKTWRFRVSGCEAILGRASTDHFCQFIEALQEAGKVEFVLLETNGIMLGYDESLVKSLSKFKDVLGVRVAIKGEDPQQFEKLSGAKASSFKYQLRSLELLYQHEVPSRPAIMSTFMDVLKISELTKIHHEDIDVERLKFYPITKKSLIERGCWDMRKVKA
ncbi:MAG: Radical SAM superfamily protein [Methanosaeta sp. PtaU1.Bin112]|nr:MAG: Radical SAM superfamily protein [Methanosaeta sp. PtaU1.Bin112]